MRPLNIRWRSFISMCYWLRDITLSSNVLLFAVGVAWEIPDPSLVADVFIINNHFLIIFPRIWSFCLKLFHNITQNLSEHSLLHNKFHIKFLHHSKYIHPIKPRFLSTRLKKRAQIGHHSHDCTNRIVPYKFLPLSLKAFCKAVSHRTILWGSGSFSDSRSSVLLNS